MSSTGVEELQLLIRSGWNLIALESCEEDRALALLQRIAQATERSFFPWTLASGLDTQFDTKSETARGAERSPHAPGFSTSNSFNEGLIEIAARDEPAVFAILDAHRLLEDPLAIRRLRDLLPQFAARRQVLVLVGPTLPLPIELMREAAVMELPLPNESELLSLFERLSKKRGGDPATSADFLKPAVRSSLGLTASEAVRVFRKACTRAGGLNDEAVADIVREKRRALGRTPALSFHQFDAGLSDVGGLGELKAWLRDRKRAFSSEARSFGLPTPRGLLLLGVQGCGKSLCAKAVAREWNFPLLRLDLAATFSSESLSPEHAIREAVQITESLAPAVLWIDEIEKGFVASESDPSSSRVFGSFLTWLSEKDSPVFVVATANDVMALPPELLRRGRFDDLFFVDLPSVAEREEIFSIHLRRRDRDPLQFHIAELAAQAERLTGAEIEQVVTAALYAAFHESRDLTEADLETAVHDTVPLYDTYEERIKELRDWSKGRARPASVDARMVDLFANR